MTEYDQITSLIPVKRKIFYSLLALLVLGVMLWAFSPRPVEVETETLQRGRFERSVDNDGWTQLRDRYVVSAPLTGHMERLLLKEGDTVRQGDVIAHLRPVSPALLNEREVQTQREHILSLQAQMLVAKTAVERAQAALQQAQSDTQRSEQLHQQHFISAAQRDTMRLAQNLREKEFQSAQYQAQVALHTLAEAEAVLRESSKQARASGTAQAVRSPVNGKVVRLPLQSENVVMMGTPIVEIGDPHQLEVVVDLLTEDATQVREGMEAQLLNWGGDALRASVRRIEPSAITKVSALGVEEQRVNVVLDILSPIEERQTLGDRFRVDVRIPVQVTDGALIAPIGAIFPHGATHALFMVHDGRVVLHEVNVVARNGRQAWLRDEPHSGLPNGAEVVIYPPPSLKNGDRIKHLSH